MSLDKLGDKLFGPVQATPLVDDDRAAELKKKLDHVCVRLQSTWWTPGQEPDEPAEPHMGFMYMEKRRFSGFKKYWFSWKGMRLLFFKKETDMKPKGSIPICFMSKFPWDLHERELFSGRDVKVSFSTHKLQIFSTSKIYQMACESDAELDAWAAKIDAYLRAQLGSEYDYRKDAANRFDPLIMEEFQEEMRRADDLRHDLRATGFGAVVKPMKQSHVKMKVDSVTEHWKRYYFQVYRKGIIYKNQDQTKAKGVIPLKFATVALEQWPSTKTPGSFRHGFSIHTPFISYFLRCKHRAASEQWVEALNLVKAGKLADAHSLSNALPAAATPSLDAATVAPYKNPVLEYTSAKRLKNITCKIKKAIVVGRSSTCDFPVGSDDRHVSRQHFRIEYANQRALFIDLGSAHGSFVNQARATKQYLRPNDQISIGQTLLTFRADPIS